jgi:hypothetical protein
MEDDGGASPYCDEIDSKKKMKKKSTRKAQQ